MVAWTAASNGEVPAHAFPAGKDGNGDALYVARASIPGGGMQLGKVRPGFGAAYIPYGGSELSVAKYEVMTSPAAFPTAYAPWGNGSPALAPSWAADAPKFILPSEKLENGLVLPATSGSSLFGYVNQSNGISNSGNPCLEFHAVVCGWEEDGTPLFAALVKHEGGLHPGKVRLGFGGANIGFGGAEIAGLNPYSVLCDVSYGVVCCTSEDEPVPAVLNPGFAGAWGTDGDGGALFFARTMSSEGINIGKIRPNSWGTQGAQIGYGGSATNVAWDGYQVLFANGGVPNFAYAENGAIPDGAVVIGCEADGTPLFAARGNGSPYNLQLGKVRHGFGGADIPYQGREVSEPSYGVLISVNDPWQGDGKTTGS
jgi:hypothetical protein